jgi:cbb3-type cytochrome oxidase subunit 3
MTMRNNIRINKNTVIHPFLFALFPTLFLYAHNIHMVQFTQTIPSLLVTLVLAILFYAVFLLALRNSRKAGIITSVFLVLFFSFGNFFNLLSRYFNTSSELPLLIFVGLWIALMVMSTLFVKSAKGDLKTITVFMNFSASSLMVIPLLTIAIFKITGTTSQRTQDLPLLGASTEHSINTREPRDIYYIIFDRYPNARTLKDEYDYDNSDFIDYLTSKGFYVAVESNANYPKTDHSLPSSLNMQYIDQLIEGKEMEDSSDWSYLHKLTQDNQVWRFLKSRGYKHIHFGSYWGVTGQNKHADTNINVYPMSEYSMLVYKSTLLYPLGEMFGLFDDRRLQWERERYKINKLMEIPEIKDPTFVFAHFLIPHEPYVFDKNGEYLSKNVVNKRSEKENFINQIIFTNSQIKRLVDGLLVNSETPPIIIIQSDEGPWPQRIWHTRFSFDWRNASQEELKMKTGILNAYYLPGLESSPLYLSVSPVNTFRIIFRNYFNQPLELLPDESYMFLNYKHPYEFINITEEVGF